MGMTVRRLQARLNTGLDRSLCLGCADTDGGAEVLRLAGESIVVCTDLDADVPEEIVNCEWLCSDGVAASDPARWFSHVPPIPLGFACWEIIGD